MGLNKYELTPEETAVCRWQYEMIGDFFSALWKAILTADQTNREKISLAFPDQVEGYKKYIREKGWWKRVEKKWAARGEVKVIKATATSQLPLLKEMHSDVGIEYLSHRLREDNAIETNLKVGDLKKMLKNFSDDTPIGIIGHFGEVKLMKTDSVRETAGYITPNGNWRNSNRTTIKILSIVSPDIGPEPN